MSVRKSVKIVIPNESDMLARQQVEDASANAHSAKSIAYFAPEDRITLVMASGVAVQIPRSQIGEFDIMDTAALARLQIGIGGDVIEDSASDVHISVSGLLRDLFGLSARQRAGGRSRSAAKAAAARQNGARGGRPAKQKRDA